MKIERKLFNKVEMFDFKVFWNGTFWFFHFKMNLFQFLFYLIKWKNQNQNKIFQYVEPKHFTEPKKICFCLWGKLSFLFCFVPFWDGRNSKISKLPLRMITPIPAACALQIVKELYSQRSYWQVAWRLCILHLVMLARSALLSELLMTAFDFFLEGKFT